jgi:hypothetical protein
MMCIRVSVGENYNNKHKIKKKHLNRNKYKQRNDQICLSNINYCLLRQEYQQAANQIPTQLMEKKQLTCNVNEIFLLY